MRILLDTSAYSELKRGHEEVSEIVRRASRVLLSVVVVGELLYGFRRGSREARNVRDLEAFLASAYVDLMDVTRVTADRFARVAASLREKGRPIPTNDVWIAAHTMESGGELVTCDRHFEAVDGLVVRVVT